MDQIQPNDRFGIKKFNFVLDAYSLLFCVFHSILLRRYKITKKYRHLQILQVEFCKNLQLLKRN